MAAIAGTWALLLSCQAGHADGAAAGPVAGATVAGGRPAEPPPADFTGGQFIDSAGCVFVRGDGVWDARQARDGSPICGYPPTFSARRTGPDRLTPLFPDTVEDEGTRIRRELTETVMAGLQTGELAGAQSSGERDGPSTGPTGSTMATGAHDPSPLPVAAAPGELPDPTSTLAASIAAAPRLRAGIARAGAGDHSAELCELLGANAGTTGTLGAPDTLGMCGGMDDVLAGRRRVAAVEPADVAPQTIHSGVKAAAAERASDKAADRRSGRVAPTTRAVKQTKSRPDLKANPGAGAFSTAMIPAGARFVQVGMFGDPDNARRAAKRLSSMGLPVSQGQTAVRGRQLQTIMAGPFDSRQGIVRALDRVRRGGFPDAYPR
ncbi:SPOR domain-containing protein [Paracoccus marinus]|uniref:SPOR domain-containing protein n=1 Tax=Paracoccus marinus TaxID=288426 RepID=UPI00163D6826|nr:SPOR domain-containing protein [Paracoccus marinus]GLS81314.1 sporulation protein [Paracoccus marinus]